ncbi:transcriptional regulator [Pseudomonas chengduensis]|uniref:histone-like nucleoid-structuring protein, MvaT/MvaU family n=1 Tax=Pseudomonas sp. o96-267 TaxID=2479853 RepID=UPI000F78D388|nr:MULTISPECIES: histone-like nucleoid-structuring protein, MvaT/MvaU family [Pseudomonas]MDH0960917.1 transcriptional regulator [Pseudomonas chengduensis]MDV5863665.1 transcriptional regulator [Pseudomonas mendocina]
MSVVAEYRSVEAELANLQAKLYQLGTDDRLQRELDLVKGFSELLEKYGFSLKEGLRIVHPDQPKEVEPKKTRKPRREVVYKNPHTLEELRVKGGNNAVLRGWRGQYGSDTVKGWIVN